MQQIFGDYTEQDCDQEHLILRFSPSSVPLHQRWYNTGLSADFAADYWATFFQARDDSSQGQQQENKDAVNYIANELLENTMKFNHRSARQPVILGLYLHPDVFKFYASNAIDPGAVQGFQDRIQRLLTGDPLHFYIEQLESNAADPGSTVSCLGLLTILCDYDARLAWKFETMSAGLVIVTTLVQLALLHRSD
jgi:hypothetical protein